MSFGKYMKTKRIAVLMEPLREAMKLRHDKVLNYEHSKVMPPPHSKVMTEADWDRINANKERKLNSRPTFRGRLK